MAREAAKTKHKSIYGVHPGVAMVQKAIQDLPARTGRSLEQWIKFIKKSGPKTETDRREWLKKEHGLGTNYAGWLAERAEGKGEDGDPEAYREMFRPLLPLDVLPSDALSDQQLEVNCDAMLKGLARLARRDRGLAKLH